MNSLLSPLFSQVIVEHQQRGGLFGGSMGIGEIAIVIIVICAIVAIVFIALREMGITIPRFVWQILGILLLVFVCVIAIRWLLSM